MTEPKLAARLDDLISAAQGFGLRSVEDIRGEIIRSMNQPTGHVAPSGTGGVADMIALEDTAWFYDFVMNGTQSPTDRVVLRRILARCAPASGFPASPVPPHAEAPHTHDCKRDARHEGDCECKCGAIAKKYSSDWHAEAVTDAGTPTPTTVTIADLPTTPRMAVLAGCATRDLPYELRDLRSAAVDLIKERDFWRTSAGQRPSFASYRLAQVARDAVAAADAALDTLQEELGASVATPDVTLNGAVFDALDVAILAVPQPQLSTLRALRRELAAMQTGSREAGADNA